MDSDESNSPRSSIERAQPAQAVTIALSAPELAELLRLVRPAWNDELWFAGRPGCENQARLDRLASLLCRLEELL